MDIEVIETLDACARLKEDWNAIVGEDAGVIQGLGVTATYDWTTALWQNDLGGQAATIIVLRDGGRLVGILPCYRTVTRSLGVPRSEIAPLTELYSGRCGFLVRGRSSEYIEKLLRFLHEELSDWDMFSFTLVEGSQSERAFNAVVARGNYLIRKGGAEVSPYILLSQSWEAYFKGLPKQFRYNLRNSDAKLQSEGNVSFKIYRDKEDANEFLDKFLEIEQASWKESAGTSVTKNLRQENFYRIWTPIAAENGWLRGAILELNGTPIAHNYGLMFEGICTCMKTSYSETYRALGISQITMCRLLRELCESENVTVFDWMGRCEPYKMRWTSSTYTCTNYVLYRKHFRGIMGYFKSRVIRTLRDAVQ